MHPENVQKVIQVVIRERAHRGNAQRCLGKGRGLDSLEVEAGGLSAVSLRRTERPYPLWKVQGLSTGPLSLPGSQGTNFHIALQFL